VIRSKAPRGKFPERGVWPAPDRISAAKALHDQVTRCQFPAGSVTSADSRFSERHHGTTYWCSYVTH
jgi:hypothetical protein